MPGETDVVQVAQTNGLPQESPKEIIQDAVPKIVAEEVAKDIVQEVSKDSQELIKETVQESPIAQEELQNDVQEIANNVQEVSNSVEESNKAVEEVSNNVVQEWSNNDVQELSNNDAQELSNNVPEEVSNNVSEEVPNNVQEVPKSDVQEAPKVVAREVQREEPREPPKIVDIPAPEPVIQQNGAPKKIPMATSLDTEAIRAAYDDVRSDGSETQWAVFKFDGPRIVRSGTGADFQKFREQFTENERAFGYIRIQTGDEMSKRQKFLFITWVGPEVSVLKRAKMSTDKSVIKNVISNFAVELQLENSSEIDLGHFVEQLNKAGGANYGTGVREI